MTQAYPLAWPEGWRRTKTPARSRFTTGDKFGSIVKKVIGELRLLGARNVVISTNLPLRNDGLPYASWAQGRQPDDTGVAVYFTRAGKQQCVPCDKWDRVADNLRAVALTIGALRGIERWGAKEMVDASFAGFVALPAQVDETKWWTVLNVTRDAPLERITAAFRSMAAQHHPDIGGSEETMRRLNVAYAAAKKEHGIGL